MNAIDWNLVLATAVACVSYIGHCKVVEYRSFLSPAKPSDKRWEDWVRQAQEHGGCLEVCSEGVYFVSDSY